jgi:hypothetical protein
VRRLALLLLVSSIALAGCDDVGSSAAPDVRAATGGKIDPADPAKTLQNTLGGETIGNTAQEEALGTARSIRAQETLDAAEEEARRIRFAGGATDSEYDRVIARYDDALFNIPNSNGYRQQRADAEAGRARMLELQANAKRQRDPAAASAGYHRAGYDYTLAGHGATTPEGKGNSYADAARAYYAGGHLRDACKAANDALNWPRDPTRRATVERILSVVPPC